MSSVPKLWRAPLAGVMATLASAASIGALSAADASLARLRFLPGGGVSQGISWDGEDLLLHARLKGWHCDPLEGPRS
eukprot:gene469-biopygen1852